MEAQVTNIKVQRQAIKQEIRTLCKKALQEKVEQIQQEYRTEQDLNTKLMQRALQGLEEEGGENSGEKVGPNNRGREGKKLAEKDRELRPEKKAKRQLVNEVMCIRKVQVQERLQRKAKEQLAQEAGEERECQEFEAEVAVKEGLPGEDPDLDHPSSVVWKHASHAE
ncbi:hypothetical protein GH733_004810, partial [Mirounga leonina]